MEKRSDGKETERKYFLKGKEEFLKRRDLQVFCVLFSNTSRKANSLKIKALPLIKPFTYVSQEWSKVFRIFRVF